MAIDIGGGKIVLSMTLNDSDSGFKLKLFEREGRRCSFSEEIDIGNYLVSLRLDWSDINDSDPVLDADIYKAINGVRGKKVKNGQWHHTNKEFSSERDKKVYSFQFKGLNLKLAASGSFALTTTLDAILVKETNSEKRLNKNKHRKN